MASGYKRQPRDRPLLDWDINPIQLPLLPEAYTTFEKVMESIYAGLGIPPKIYLPSRTHEGDQNGSPSGLADQGG